MHMFYLHALGWGLARVRELKPVGLGFDRACNRQSAKKHAKSKMHKENLRF